MTIHKKLSKAQKTLKAPKNQYNSFGKYKYRSCEDILEGLKSVLDDCTVVVSDEIVAVGNRVYVKATATFSDGTEHVSNTAYAREAEQKKGMDESQVTGTASSYARKYALNGLFLIDDTKDADSMDNREAKPKTDFTALIEKYKSLPDDQKPGAWEKMNAEQQQAVREAYK